MSAEWGKYLALGLDAKEIDYKKERVQLPQDFVPNHYDLSITTDFVNFTFTGDLSVSANFIIGAIICSIILFIIHH